jgi:hypothetical protein
MLVESRYGLIAGQPTHPDPNVDPVTVDWTFDDADPRFALEVTTLRDSFETPTSEHVEQFRAAIRRHGRKVGWPRWVLGIREETSLNAALAPAVTRLIDWMIAAHLDRLGPAGYVRDVPPDLLHSTGRRFMDDCEQARLNGLIQISRTSGDEVQLLPMEEWSDSRSLRRPLERTLRNKADALRRAKACGHVTMLGVEVVREDAQVELRRARRAPGLPRPQTICGCWYATRAMPALHAPTMPGATIDAWSRCGRRPDVHSQRRPLDPGMDLWESRVGEVQGQVGHGLASQRNGHCGPGLAAEPLLCHDIPCERARVRIIRLGCAEPFLAIPHSSSSSSWESPRSW